MKSSDADTPKGAKKKTRGPKKKNKKDPNEPQKPISAYALFFRDTQVAIKGQNPNATFGEVSKIVASMWDSLDPESKNNYKETADAAKKEYVKALAAYRASLLSKASSEQSDSNQSESISEPAIQPDSPVVELAADAPTEEHSDAPAVEPTEEPMVTPVITSPPVIILSPHPIKSPPTKSAEPNNSEDIVITIDSSAEEDAAIDEKPKSPQPVTNSSSPPKQDTSDTTVQNGPSINSEKIQPIVIQICLRNGCTNPAIDSPEWDREYCSSDCVVEHCSVAFLAHIATRQKNTATMAEKN